MLVIVVSECEKKAFTRSRRVLNKYLFQYGRRTWMGRLSEEGLEAMRSELKARASRHMAVACHRVLGARRTELAWVVGTRRHFSRTGEYAFAVTGQDVVTPVREKTMPERLVGHMAHLVGLLHDLGKAVAGFQDKLRHQSPAADMVRHDLLSALLLLRLLGVRPEGERRPRPEDLPPDIDTQEEYGWPGLLTDASFLRARMDELQAEDGLFPAAWLWKDDGDAAPLTFLDPELPDGYADRNPLLRWLLWLVTSHHRRPHGQKGKIGGEDRVRSTGREHIRTDADPEEDSRLFRQLAPNPGFWWEDDGAWAEAVAEAAGRLQRLLAAPGFDAVGLFPLMEGHVRPALLLADQMVSSEKKPTGPLQEAGPMLANSADEQAGQGLREHLMAIGGRASHYARLSLRRAPFPRIDPDEQPEALRREPAPATQPERFRWQDRARLAVRDHVADGIREGGGFYLLMAGTGRGKTLGIPKLLAELSEGGLRYSLGLGLRTLTLQSGEDYQDKVGFGADQMATLVGSPLARQLHALDRADGSESDMQASLVGQGLRVFGDSGWSEMDDKLRAFLERKGRLRPLIEAPVTVSTVDHLIGPVVERGTGSAAVQLRLMTADLALDEIDQYASRDLVNIGKLIHLAGVYGRKVVLASATLPPAIAEHFYAAYRAGWQAYCRRVDQAVPLFAGWIADEVTVRKDLSEAELADEHRAWVAEETARLAGEAPLRRAELLDGGEPGESAEDLRPLFAAVTERARALHGEHHVAVEGRRVSLGLVRWMNVAVCREYARYLVDEADPDADLRVVCYHARHLPATRYEIERTLDDLLHRERELADRLEESWDPDEHPGLAALHRALESSRAADLMIVVSATTVEDTGRDHDFDWAVWEPNDLRSAPQTAGRVFRHRPGRPVSAAPNVAILRRNWRSAVEKDSMAFRWPGPEGAERIHSGKSGDESRAFQVGDYADRYPDVEADPADFERAGPMALFRQRVDATPAISDEPRAPLADLEHARLAWLLGPRSGDPAYDGLAGYLASAGVRATDFHVRASPFRGGPDSAVEFALTSTNHLKGEGWPWQWRRSEDSDFDAAPTSALRMEPPLENRHRLLLLVPDHKELVRGLASRLGGDDHDRVRDLTTIELALYPRESPNRLVLHFDPDLGGRRGRETFPVLRPA